MGLHPGDPYYGEFTTGSPRTGALNAADSLPVATANRNGSDDADFVLTVAPLTAGRYVVIGTVPADYQAQDVVSISVVAVIDSVTGGAVIDSFLVTLPEPSAAELAAAIWTDQEAGDFAIDGTPGQVLVRQLGGAFTSRSSSVFTAEALVLAPGGTVSGHDKIAVDHNYGGTDALTVVTATSTPVGDAFITAYLRIDYEAGHYGPEFVAGQTTTDAHGRWRFHLLLGEGEYILLITKPGVIAPKVVAVTVAA